MNLMFLNKTETQSTNKKPTEIINLIVLNQKLDMGIVHKYEYYTESP